MIDELQLMTGVDIPCPDLKITIRQPKIKDIAVLGEEQYFIGLQIATLTLESLGRVDNTAEISNWDLFTQCLEQEMPKVADVRALMINFLHLFLPVKPIIGPNSLLLQIDGEFQNIEPDQWNLLQSYISEVGGKTLLTVQEEEFKPGNKRAAEIAEKMKKARQKLKALEPANTTNNPSFLAKFLKAAVVALKLPVQELNNLTILQLNSLVQMYLHYEAYDIEVKSRLAGAKNDDKLIHWLSRDDPSNKPDGVGTLSE